MVKTKKIFAVLLAVVTALCMTTAANASSFDNTVNGYRVTGTFTKTSNTASASMNATYVSGNTVSQANCQINGTVRTSTGSYTLTGSSTGFSTVASTGYTGTFRSGDCSFYFCGGLAGYLTL